MAFITPNRKPINLFSHVLSNNELCPQSCIKENVRDERRIKSMIIGIKASVFVSIEVGELFITLIRTHKQPIGKIVDNTCQKALASLRPK